MKWKIPSAIKVYEALGTLADGRVKLLSPTEAHVSSSSGGKFYTVTYDPAARSIMANDNASYWQGSLGYPAIAFLLAVGSLRYDEQCSRALKGIAWKDINTKFKNDFGKTVEYVHERVTEQGIESEALKKEAASIEAQLRALDLSFLGKKKKPPAGY